MEATWALPVTVRIFVFVRRTDMLQVKGRLSVDANSFHVHYSVRTQFSLFLLPLTLYQRILGFATTSQRCLINGKEWKRAEWQLEELRRRKKISNARTSLSVSLNHVTYCLRPPSGGSRGPQFDSLIRLTRASPLVNVFIPFRQVVNWPPRLIFSTTTCLGRQSVLAVCKEYLSHFSLFILRMNTWALYLPSNFRVIAKFPLTHSSNVVKTMVYKHWK